MANTNYTNNKDRVPTGKYQKKNYDLELASDSEYRMKDESTKQVTIETMSSKVTIPAKLDVDVTSIDLDDDLKQFMVETALDIGTNDLPFDFVLTSGLEGKHAPGSKHYSGRAIDIRISDKYRGYNEGVDTPWDDPVYKYFYEGKGKILLERYNIDLLDNLRHGDAPHLHLETEDGEGGYDNSDIKTQSDYMMDGEVDRLQKQQEDLLRFTTEINNETQKVEDKAEEVDTNPALDYLQRQQEYRQMMTDLITDYSENMLTETPKDTPIQQSPGAYTPNQIVTTRFQTLEQATGRQQFADGGEKSQPWAGRSFDRPEPYEMSQDEIIGMKQHALGMSLTDIPEFWDKFNAKKLAQEEKYKQWETEAERSRFDETFETKQTSEGLESKYSLPELKVEGKISKPDYKDPSGNNWKNWDKLTPEEQMIVKNNAGENQYQLIRLQQKAGYDEGEWVERGGDAMMAMPITMAKGVVQPLQVAQTLLVESVEAMRGNDYDFNRANPFSYKNVSSWNVGLEDIRTPSQVWLPEDAPEELKFVLDVVADPSNLAGGAGIFRNLATKGTKAAIKNFGKNIVRNVSDNLVYTGDDLVTAGYNPFRRFTAVDTKLKNIEQQGIKEGLSPVEIAKKQMDEVGITTKQREAYTPVLSDLLYHGINPRGTKWGTIGRVLETPTNLLSAPFRKGASPARLGARDDAWSLFLGRPQKSGTFRIADTAPTSGVYNPEDIASMERFSITAYDKNPMNLQKSIIDDLSGGLRNQKLNETRLGKLAKGESLYPHDYASDVMGNFNLRRTSPNTLEYNDIWDLNVPGVPDFISNKVIGRPFLSTGQKTFDDLSMSLKNLADEYNLKGSEGFLDDIKDISSPKAQTFFKITEGKAKPFYKMTQKEANDLVDNALQERIDFWNTPEGTRRLKYQVENTNPSLSDADVTLMVNKLKSDLKNAKNLTKDAAESAEIFHNIEGFKKELTQSYKAGNMSEKYYNKMLDKYTDMQSRHADNYKLITQGGGDLPKGAYARGTRDHLGNWSEPGVYVPRSSENIAYGQFSGSLDPMAHARHEIGHLGQRFPKEMYTTYIDEKLMGLTLKDVDKATDPELYNALDYFITGSNFSERLPFLEEVRSRMLTEGVIKDFGDKVTPEMIENFYKESYKGRLRKNQTRLFDLINPSDKGNFTLLSDIMNNLPAAVPIVGGLGTAGYMSNLDNGTQ